MEELLQKQKSKNLEIAQLVSNYKKDGADRKTKRYLENKIDTIKKLYNQYVDGDEEVQQFQPPLVSTHQYFEERKETVDMFDATIKDMRTRLNGAPTTPTIPLTSHLGTSFTLTSDDNSTKPIFSSMSNLQQMLKQQDFRMRALYREIMSVKEILETNKSRPALAIKQKKNGKHDDADNRFK